MPCSENTLERRKVCETRDSTMTRMRRLQWVLLGISWYAFAWSLVAPGTTVSDFGGRPTVILGVVCYLVSWTIPWLVVANLCFLFSPAFLALNSGRRASWLWRFPVSGVLLCWLPLHVVDPIPPLWGYFLYGGAYTLAFVAVQLGPWPPKFDKRRGFPVAVVQPSPRPLPPLEQRDGTEQRDRSNV